MIWAFADGAVDVLPHHFLLPTDLGYPLTASTGENLRQVWTMMGIYNITVTCPFGLTLHCWCRIVILAPPGGVLGVLGIKNKPR